MGDFIEFGEAQKKIKQRKNQEGSNAQEVPLQERWVDDFYLKMADLTSEETETSGAEEFLYGYDPREPDTAKIRLNTSTGEELELTKEDYVKAAEKVKAEYGYDPNPSGKPTQLLDRRGRLVKTAIHKSTIFANIEFVKEDRFNKDGAVEFSSMNVRKVLPPNVTRIR